MVRPVVKRSLPWAIGLLIVGAIALAIPKSWYSQDALDRQQRIGKYAGVLTDDQRAKVDREIPRLETFVAARRGAPFPAGISVQYIGDRAFKTRVEHGDLDTPEGIGAVQYALGIERSSNRTAARLRHINVSDIVGLYFPGQVLMRGDHLGVENTDILVHELTHAWDNKVLGQRDRRAGRITPDHNNALDAIAEGDATAVQADYLDSLNPNLGCEVMEELEIPFTEKCLARHYVNGLSVINPGDIDAPAEAYYRFSYDAGAIFVRALRSHGGEAEVNRALIHPPVDTAQVIEPTLYLQHTAPIAVAPPAVGHRVGPAGTLGELGVSVVVTDGAFNLGTKNYLRGWAGDRYVDTREHGQRCVHDHLELRTAAAGRIAFHRFTAWAHERPGRHVVRAGPAALDFTTCGT